MIWMYTGFVLFIVTLLALDLGVFHRKAHVVSVREALGWSTLWIGLGLAFSLFVYVGYENHWLGLGLHGAERNDGGSAVVKYLTGFVLEKSLAVDNIFVIAMIFTLMKVPPIHQHRLLFWGVLGALLMRGVMIGVGAVLIARFSWILYVFGGFLILTGVKMLLAKDEAPADLENSRMMRIVRRVAPNAPPLLVALIMVELTDVVFAVDSIPAIFAVTTDTFLVFTSNVFAILGLRSLYFALAGMIDRFKYLKVSLSLVLVVIGAKMLSHEPLKAWLGAHFNFYVLGVVLTLLVGGVLASMLASRPGITVRWNG